MLRKSLEQSLMTTAEYSVTGQFFVHWKSNFSAAIYFDSLK